MGRKYCEDRCSGNSDKFECSTCGKKFQVSQVFRQHLVAPERVILIMCQRMYMSPGITWDTTGQYWVGRPLVPKVL